MTRYNNTIARCLLAACLVTTLLETGCATPADSTDSFMKNAAVEQGDSSPVSAVAASPDSMGGLD